MPPSCLSHATWNDAHSENSCQHICVMFTSTIGFRYGASALLRPGHSRKKTRPAHTTFLCVPYSFFPLYYLHHAFDGYKYHVLSVVTSRGIPDFCLRVACISGLSSFYYLPHFFSLDCSSRCTSSIGFPPSGVLRCPIAIAVSWGT